MTAGIDRIYRLALAEDGATIYPGSNLCKMNPANNRRALLPRLLRPSFQPSSWIRRGIGKH
jgi:hypothetical protein